MRVHLFNMVRVRECCFYTVCLSSPATHERMQSGYAQKMQAQEKENSGNAFPWARMLIASARLTLAFAN
jgi:hypothetical protein